MPYQGNFPATAQRTAIQTTDHWNAEGFNGSKTLLDAFNFSKYPWAIGCV
jgi:hypothetical protein